jgi:hypothetical protein
MSKVSPNYIPTITMISQRVLYNAVLDLSRWDYFIYPVK